MGHSCRICGRSRPNERFSGKGHRTHICKECQRLPRAERFRIDALNDIERYLFRQSNISKKNLSRLAELAQCDDPKVRELAAVVLEIGKAHPGRRRRFKSIKKERPELWQDMIRVGIVEEWPEELEFEEDLRDFGEVEENWSVAGQDFAYEDDIPF